jgi:hypothetical protein
VTILVECNRQQRYLDEWQWNPVVYLIGFYDLTFSAVMDTVLLPMDGILWLFWTEGSTDAADSSAEGGGCEPARWRYGFVEMSEMRLGNRLAALGLTQHIGPAEESAKVLLCVPVSGCPITGFWHPMWL